MTASQFQALEDISRTGNPWARVRGKSQYGGWSGVIHVITREEWAHFSDGRWVVTEAGTAAMKQFEKKHE